MELSKIKNNPLHYMSLANTELFHSNFWAWLIENDKNFAKVFFDDIDSEQIERICREDGHRDITIHMKYLKTEKGTCYVIENKIKALPTNKQLEDYKNNINKNGLLKRGLLTGICETMDLSHMPEWNFESYHDISIKIREYTKISKQEVIIKNRFIIETYCDLIENISELLLEKLENSKNYLSYMQQDLNEIRYESTYKKMKASQFLNFFNDKYLQEINNKAKEIGFEYVSWTGFSNKHAIIDFKICKFEEIPNKKERINSFSLGVQLEEYAFRISAESRDKKQTLEERTKNTYNYYLKNGWFDKNYSKKNKVVFNNKTNMSKDYCKYETDDYSFVYQYFNIYEELKDFEKLAELVKKYLEKALIILKLI